MLLGKAVPSFGRTGADVSGFRRVHSLGITAQFVLAIAVIFYVLPWMGLELLEDVAEFDLPMRVLGLL
jgi:hypothetical protein